MRLLRYLNEDVININMEKIHTILINIKWELVTPSNIIKILNDAVKNENVIFKNVKEHQNPSSIKTTTKAVALGYATKTGKIYVFLNMNVLIDEMKYKDDWLDDFILDACSVINHEYVHRKQFLRMNAKYLNKSWKELEIKDDPYELMAYSINVVYELWATLGDYDYILSEFKKNHSVLEYSETYNYVIKQLDDKAKNKLHSNIYRYLIKNMPEK